MIPPELLARAEASIATALATDDRSSLPIIGSGETSLVLGLEHEGRLYACKRIAAAMDDATAFERYCDLSRAYAEALDRGCGIRLPLHAIHGIDGGGARRMVYIVQERLPAGSFVNRALGALDADAGLALVDRVYAAIASWARYNAAHPHALIGLDAQVANWAVVDDRLIYIDTTTPMMRNADGRELLDVEIFLKTMPRTIVWLVRLVFLREVLNRYYDLRQVLRDLVANLIKERLDALLPGTIERANALLAEHATGGAPAPPITLREVRKYYQSDARMWEILMRLRYYERWVRRKLLRRPYPYLLPERVRR